MNLTEFLLACIAEDEDVARALDAGRHEDAVAAAGRVGGGHVARWSPARVLAECEAKRRIVERFRWAADKSDLYVGDMALVTEWETAIDTLADLATIYADHPDYREEWRP